MAELMTVGELAKRVGVTVRTIQYYDQRGLLHPSQLGEGNQRLYSDADEQEIRRILVLKYLGLSLSDIANQDITTKSAFDHAVQQSQDRLSQEIVRSFERMSALKALSHAFEGAEDIDWSKATSLISLVQSNSEQFWEQVAKREDEQTSQDALSREEVLAWHSLMGSTIEAMQKQLDPRSEKGMALGARYMSMGGRDRAMIGMGLMGAPGKVMHSMDERGRAFYQKLQQRTLEFLDSAKEASAHSGSNPTE